MMKTIKGLILAAAIAAIPAIAEAQTCPTFTQGRVLTAGQWQACFDAKQNVINYTPLNKAGDTMLGRLVVAAPSGNVGFFNLTPGSTPGSPNNGDLWVTSAGFFVQINGATVGPLIGGTGSVIAFDPVTPNPSAPATGFKFFANGVGTPTWLSSTGIISSLGNTVDVMAFRETADGSDLALALQRAHDSTACANGCIITVPTGSTYTLATPFNQTRSNVWVRGLGCSFGSGLAAPTINVTYTAGPAWVIGSLTLRPDNPGVECIRFSQDAGVNHPLFNNINSRALTMRSVTANSIYAVGDWGDAAATTGPYIWSFINCAFSARGPYGIKVISAAGGLYLDDTELDGPAQLSLPSTGTYAIYFPKGTTAFARFDEVFIANKSYLVGWDKGIYQDNTRIGNVTIVASRFDVMLSTAIHYKNDSPDATGGGAGSTILSNSFVQAPQPIIIDGTAARVGDIVATGNYFITTGPLAITAGTGANSSNGLNITGNIFYIAPTAANQDAVSLTGEFNGLAVGVNTFTTDATGGFAARYAINFASVTGTGHVVSVQGAYGFSSSTVNNNPTPIALVPGSNTQIPYNSSGVFAADANFAWVSASVALSIGQNATGSSATTGTIALNNGIAGGASVNLRNLATTTTWNFNFPTTAGTTGQPLVSAGGLSASMTWGTLTGTGAFVLATSPTLVTPTLGVAGATSINKVALTAPATSATLTLADGSTLTQTTSTSIGRGQYLGTATNDTATAGNIGELISSEILAGSAVTVLTATPTDITSITLTPGDWDVKANFANVQTGGSTISAFAAAASMVSVTFPASPNAGAYLAINQAFTPSTNQSYPIGTIRTSVSSNTTVYLVGLLTFTGGSQKGYGFLGARRVR